MAKRARRTAVRYAVVGLGHIAQVAVLPAFAHARRNSVLAAIVSDDPTKRRALSKKYKVPAYSYDTVRRLSGRGRCGVHRAAQLAARRVRHSRRQRRRARALREAAGRHGGRMRADDRRLSREPRQAHGRVSAAFRRDQSEGHRSRPSRTHRRSEVLQLVVLDDRSSGRHPDEAGARWRHAVRHRRVLHQRGARAVPGGAKGSDRAVGQQRGGAG